jgi:hypothetical protein
MSYIVCASPLFDSCAFAKNNSAVNTASGRFQHLDIAIRSSVHFHLVEHMLAPPPCPTTSSSIQSQAFAPKAATLGDTDALRTQEQPRTPMHSVAAQSVVSDSSESVSHSHRRSLSAQRPLFSPPLISAAGFSSPPSQAAFSASATGSATASSRKYYLQSRSLIRVRLCGWRLGAWRVANRFVPDPADAWTQARYAFRAFHFDSNSACMRINRVRINGLNISLTTMI